MATYQVLYWKDIPAQVKVFESGSKPLARTLPPRFQDEIDRIAMQEGLTGTDEYLNQWHWGPKQERPGSQAEVIEQVIRELIAASPLQPDHPERRDSELA
jgi:hypothetical protein